MKPISEGFRNDEVVREWSASCQGAVAFLRYRIPGVSELETSDWDVAVRNAPFVREKTTVLLGRPWLEVRRTYVEQNYFQWGQLDLLPSFEWDGVVFLDAERFWNGVVVSEDGLPRPRVAHDALIVLLTGLLGGKNYRVRYNELLKRALAEDAREFLECLRENFGEILTGELENMISEGHFDRLPAIAGDLRRHIVFRKSYRAPGDLLEGVIRHWFRELVLHWRPPHPWIAFLGPDGAGKTTAIKGLAERLGKVRLKSHLIHWRPKWDDLPEGESVPVVNPQGESPRGKFASTASLLLLWLRWLVGRFGRTWHKRSKQKVLLSDRYYQDLLVDPLRYRYGGSLRLARWFFRFFPKPDLTVILMGAAEVIMARKQEVPRSELERQLAAYRALAREVPNEVCLIDCDQPESAVVDDLQHLIVARLFKKKK